MICRRTIVVAIAASVFLPIGASDASWLSDVFKNSAKSTKSSERSSPKQAASPKRSAMTKSEAPSKRRKSAVSASTKTSTSQQSEALCDPSTFRIAIDVGHTAESEGAISARNVAEYAFNLRLAKRIDERLKANGFAATRLLLTEGKARRSLVKRVAKANSLPANLFLSIHHDSVPNTFLETWEFEGKKSHFSDRFRGYSVFVSRNNPHFKTSLEFAELLGKNMKAQGLEYAHQYAEPIMGRYRHPLLNKDTGVYSYDQLVVLRTTQMPAVLLEAGSIINRDEELRMASTEHQDMISDGVASAVKAFCESRKAVIASP